MTKAIAVIGAMYGDCGKGLVTDYFASQSIGNTAVVRFNGSSQAGHTVQLSDGTRHVFSHFGCGSFVGKPTVLSEFFVVHPMMFIKEHKELISMGMNPIVYVDSRSLVTTPYDMIVNQIIENRRGDKRHGSVGIGFGETFERTDWMEITVDDLIHNNADLTDKLELIRERWVPTRIGECKSPQEGYLYDALASPQLMQDFIDCCEHFKAYVKYDWQYDDFSDLIFEGAQGLMLDQTYGVFPHVTRSNTGVKNIVEILKNVSKVEKLSVNYVSRAYTTRHGAGPLPYEVPFPEHIVDNTNHHHLFQGALRYSPLNIDVLLSVTEKDLNQLCGTSFDLSEQLIFTCLDQIKDVGQYIFMEELVTVNADIFTKQLRDIGDYVSYGPTRDHIQKIR